MNRLYNRIEPFPSLFWALGIVLPHILYTVQYILYTAVTQHAGLASPNHGTGTVMYRTGQLGSTKEASPTTRFLSSCTYSMISAFYVVLYSSCFNWWITRTMNTTKLLFYIIFKSIFPIWKLEWQTIRRGLDYM